MHFGGSPGVSVPLFQTISLCAGLTIFGQMAIFRH
jgi:hypothetical protein